MFSINKQVLELVRNELQTELERLVASLGQSSSSQVTGSLLQGLSDINGVFSLLQMQGGQALVVEIGLLLKKSESEPEPLLEEQWASIEGVIKLLPEHFKLVQSTGYDNPLLLLPEINELRQYQKKAARSEYFFLAPLLPKQPIVTLLMTRDDQPFDVIRLARHLFQKGLIHAVRGSGRKAAVKIMAHGIHRLRKVMVDESELLYWSMVFEVLGALYRGTLSFGQTHLRALIAIERQLKMLADNASHEKCYPEDQQMAMLAHFMLSGCNTESARKLCDQLSVEPLNFTAKDIAGQRARMLASGGINYHETIILLSGKYDELSFILDELFLKPEENTTLRGQLREGFMVTADLCAVLKLSEVSERCSQHAKALAAIDIGQTVPEELIDEMVNSLLYLDSIVAELRDQSPSEHELLLLNQKPLTAMVELNVVDHAERRVLQEALSSLAEVIRASGDYFDGVSDDGILGESLSRSSSTSTVEHFSAIVGSIKILGLDRASDVAQRCLSYFEKHFIDTSEATKEIPMVDVFADAIVSLEYYLDNRRWDANFDDSVLSVAEGCLTKLESQ